MNLELSFQHQYEIQILTKVPTNTCYKTHIYPNSHAPRTSGDSSITFLVRPLNADPWIGILALGPFVTCVKSNGIYACPNPRYFCVLAEGQALIIDSEAPQNWTVAPSEPVLDVKALSEHDLLIFTDFTRMSAWGRDGLCWTTRPLAFNGLRITHTDDKSVYGMSLDVNGPFPLVPFQIDLQTGYCTGGCWLLESLVPISQTSKALLADWFESPNRVRPHC